MPQKAFGPIRSALVLSALFCPAGASWADMAPGIPPLDMPAPSSREVPTESDRPFYFRAHWDNDVVGNVHGGIRRGAALDSTAQASVTVNGNRLDLPGATFYAAMFAFHTGKASERLIGDRLGVSNIEAHRNGLALAAAYWAQEWRPGLSTQIGVFDLNSVFDVTDSASQLLNGSFGLDPTLTDNFDVSTFPRNGSGGIVQWQQANLSLRAGLFQGEVDQQSQPFDGGAMGIVEAAWQRADNNLKLGVWQKRGQQTPDLYGVYFSGERVLAGSAHPMVGFLRASLARGRGDAPAPELQRYIGFGFNWQAPLHNRPRDHLTFGFGQVQLHGSGGHRHERVTELAYIFRINKRLYLQPDIQYIDRPDGNLPPALVTTLRLHIE